MFDTVYMREAFEAWDETALFQGEFDLSITLG